MNGKANEKRDCFQNGNSLFKGVDKIVGGIDVYASPLYEAPLLFWRFEKLLYLCTRKGQTDIVIAINVLTLSVRPFACYAVM